MSDWKHRGSSGFAAMALILGLIGALILYARPSCSEAFYPFPADQQKKLLKRAASLFIRWDGRELPSPGLRWASPEWFAIKRGNTERSTWGTIDGSDVVMNEAAIRHPFLGQSPVLESLLLHEYVHILQRSMFGPPTDCMDLHKREIEAYRVQSAYLRAEGANLALNPEAALPACE